MRSECNPSISAVPPALIGVCIDRLQRLPRASCRIPDQLMLVATCTGRDEQEAAALFVRLVTAAFVCRDPRWRVWREVSRSSVDCSVWFEAQVLDLFATLPLQHLAASADGIFDHLIARCLVQGRG
jgi:hypothetical protein